MWGNRLEGQGSLNLNLSPYLLPISAGESETYRRKCHKCTRITNKKGAWYQNTNQMPIRVWGEGWWYKGLSVATLSTNPVKMWSITKCRELGKLDTITQEHKRCNNANSTRKETQWRMQTQCKLNTVEREREREKEETTMKRERNWDWDWNSEGKGELCAKLPLTWLGMVPWYMVPISLGFTTGVFVDDALRCVGEVWLMSSEANVCMCMISCVRLVHEALHML